MLDVSVVAILVGGVVVIGLVLIGWWYDRASARAYEQFDRDIKATYARHYAEVEKIRRRYSGD